MYERAIRDYQSIAYKYSLTRERGRVFNGQNSSDGEVRIMEYFLNSLSAVSRLGPLHELEDTLASAVGAVTTFADNLLESLATMDPATIVVLGVISFIVLFVISYFALLTA